jgi:hypothetical protein
MNRLITASAALLFASTAFAATAHYTYRSEVVTTVTGRTGISCEYSYMGQTFWRTFAGFGSCPATVEVE